MRTAEPGVDRWSRVALLLRSELIDELFGSVLYRFLARFIAGLHIAFVFYVVLGSLLVFYWPWTMWLHVAAVLWAALTLTADMGCPLTFWEKGLLRRGGREPYPEGFLQHHLFRREFSPERSGRYHAALGLGALAVNVAVYALVFLK